MAATEVPRSDWNRFFDRFTRLHNGAIVSVNVSGVLFGCQNAALDRPLRGISADRGDVLIDTDHLGHRVPSVRRVAIQSTAEGAVAALDLDAGDGTRTVVRFRSPVLDELLDPGVE
ncbi:MAG TPA: DUF5335 family protein [Thermoanaerobaculia bacterium]|nr:DUF5335 family protein [Thermoanaerobaculia bacterium]